MNNDNSTRLASEISGPAAWLRRAQTWIPEEQVPNPRTATMEWWWAEMCDPYGQRSVIPPEEQCVGRVYFLVEKGKRAVLDHDLRELHAEIDDGEWAELMREAAARDESSDPFPYFHRYRR